MLTFQQYLTFGIAIMSGIGALMVALDRMRRYTAARLISLLVLFPIVYSVAVFPSSRLEPFVTVGEEFAVFKEIPFLVAYILTLSLTVAIILLESSGKWLGIGYLSVGSLVCLGMPWCLSDAFVLVTSGFSALILLLEGGLTYKEGRRMENEESRVLSFVRSRGEVRIENVMARLQMSDAEARRALYELWRKGRLQKREDGTLTIYYTSLNP